MDDYVGLVALVAGVGIAVWYFWGKIMNKLGK